jgi:Phage integrase family
MDGLAPSERPKQRNKKRVARLDAATISKLVAAGSTERWRAALGLAGYAGLRLGEIRVLTWADVDLNAGTVSVSRSLLPDGAVKAPKIEAGVRTIPLLPALRRCLSLGKLKAPHSRPRDLVIGTADGKPVDEHTLRRALNACKQEAVSTRSMSGCRGTASGIRLRLCSRLTSGWHRRRSRSCSVTPTLVSRCERTRAMLATLRRLLRTFLSVHEGRASVASQPFSQPCASVAGIPGRRPRP